MKASEIYNLDLGVNLAVLSACNTGVGEINPGDGVRSITRSFIQAGCNNVVTTLWEAPDLSTSKIISAFYQNINQGSTMASSLRKAKLDYLQNIQSTYKHPKYWAHLILVGGNEPESRHYKSLPYLIFGSLIFLVLGFIIIKKK